MPRFRMHAAVLALAVLVASLFGSSAQAGTALPDDLKFLTSMNALWRKSRGLYETDPFPLSRQQALMLRLHVRAISNDEPTFLNDKERAISLVRVLTRSPSFIDGKRSKWTTSVIQRHIPGFTANAAGRPGIQHVATSSAVALALAEAYVHANKIGLSAKLKARIRHAVNGVASHGIFSPRHIRAGQLVWTADMLWARRLVSGNRRRFVRDYRVALSSMKPIIPKMLTRAGGFRYNWKYPGDANNRMDSPEYSALSLSGLRYLSQARKDGMRISTRERSLFKRWAKRVIWGNFSNSGLLNWDTGLGGMRRYLTQYWGWSVLGAQSLETSGLISSADRSRLRGLCRKAQDRFIELQADDGFTPKLLYGSHSAFLKDNGDTTLSTQRLYLSLRTCPSGGSTAAASSFDAQQPRFAVTTSRYTTSIVGWAKYTAYGILPNKLLDQDGNAIGGLGSRSTQFDFVAGGLRLGQGQLSGSRIRLRARSGSGPLGSRRRLSAVMTRGGTRASVRYSFGSDGFQLKGKLNRSLGRLWRIPLQSGTKSVRSYERGRTVVTFEPKRGNSWSVSVAGKASIRGGKLSSSRYDRTARDSVILRLPKGSKIDLSVRVKNPVPAPGEPR